MHVPRLVPQGTRSLRLALAAVVWSAVGAGLGIAGTRWLIGSEPDGGWVFLGVAVGVGWAKGRFVLRPRALANAERIVRSADRASLLTIFTPATWLLVAAMMACGFTLRHSHLPWGVVGWIYATVGTALLVGAATSWAVWARHRAPSGSLAL